MATQINVKNLDEKRCLGLVSRTAPHDFGGVWGKMHAQEQRDGRLWVTAFAAKNMAKEMRMDWYAACVVDDKAAKAPLEEVKVGGGKHAVHVYVGGYEGLGQAWPAFTKALLAAGHVHDESRPCFEVYVDDGKTSGTPSTELIVPIK